MNVGFAVGVDDDDEDDDDDGGGVSAEIMCCRRGRWLVMSPCLGLSRGAFLERAFLPLGKESSVGQ